MGWDFPLYFRGELATTISDWPKNNQRNESHNLAKGIIGAGDCRRVQRLEFSYRTVGWRLGMRLYLLGLPLLLGFAKLSGQRTVPSHHKRTFAVAASFRTLTL